eukprot:TRINITY_DN22623_c0_g1_i1.p1 TRINITY_DN22623_c0_g1~~TRINITY_DN22623_c0_g1_i1.p1  ORF type:complete len:350 (+),score=70.43 TRINITY_DN22623_c0_g1_i1:106-1155(+)
MFSISHVSFLCLFCSSLASYAILDGSELPKFAADLVARGTDPSDDECAAVGYHRQQLACSTCDALSAVLTETNTSDADPTSSVKVASDSTGTGSSHAAVTLCRKCCVASDTGDELCDFAVLRVSPSLMHMFPQLDAFLSSKLHKFSGNLAIKHGSREYPALNCYQFRADFTPSTKLALPAGTVTSSPGEVLLSAEAAAVARARGRKFVDSDAADGASKRRPRGILATAARIVAASDKEREGNSVLVSKHRVWGWSEDHLVSFASHRIRGGGLPQDSVPAATAATEELKADAAATTQDSGIAGLGDILRSDGADRVPDTAANKPSGKGASSKSGDKTKKKSKKSKTKKTA